MKFNIPDINSIIDVDVKFDEYPINSPISVYLVEKDTKNNVFQISSKDKDLPHLKRPLFFVNPEGNEFNVAMQLCDNNLAKYLGLVSVEIVDGFKSYAKFKLIK